MEITKDDIREIVREENERILKIYLDAKSTATAMEHGLFHRTKLSSHACGSSKNQSSVQELDGSSEGSSTTMITEERLRTIIRMELNRFRQETIEIILAAQTVANRQPPAKPGK